MKKIIIVAATFVALSSVSMAQTTDEEKIQEYRDMIADGNPAELYVDDGEELWSTPNGPKKATLEKCDLGLGAGVVEGAAAKLPKYFKDTKKVQDLESRLMTCMETLQGIDPKVFIKGKFGKGKMEYMEAVVAYVVKNSNGKKIDVGTSHAEEKRLYDLGERAFFYRAGPMDFSCASCHALDGKRIRLQGLPNITKHKDAVKSWSTWPAYRVGKGAFWTMQRRIAGCFRQQRFPYPAYTSEITIALSVYMAQKANGGIMQTPGLKR